MSPREEYGVLIVDDEAIVISLVKDALEEMGYKIYTASNGIDALDIIHSKTIDLLITDIRMSPMNGIELAETSRKFCPSLNVIFMTGYANLNSAKDAIKYGAVDYILKPFELSEIRQSVEKAIQIIKDTRAEKSSVSQLNRLSDLSQILYKAGDQKSLVTISLRYAILQMNADRGCMIYWDKKKNNFKIVTIVIDDTKVVELPSEKTSEIIEQIDFSLFLEPKIISSIHDHPLCKYLENNTEIKEVFPWHSDNPNVSLAVSLVRRSDSVYGIIAVGNNDANATLREDDLKSLAITSSNLSLSLENSFLLEETQAAYDKLKEIQDDTIELEKMATRGQISAEIGHELNNFVGVVAGNLSLLDHHIKKKNYSKVDGYVVTMIDNIEKIKKFTNNLMDLTPISSVKELLFFDKLVSEVIDNLIPQKRFEDVMIEFQQADGEIPFEADNTQIKQLLYNLLNNAADATEEKDVRKISITTQKDVVKKNFTISIEDNGCGFDPKSLETAFKEQFTTKPTGHGFGLMVCKKIIESNNGLLNIESSPGNGAKITIEFPMAEEITAVLTT